ncbi:MAG: hypothetical protein SCJ93_13885 [Bacillota bacterium]|nr:hypothetical protein [Bacillota bacterium]
MKLNNMILSIAIAAIFIVGIMISDYLGYWQTESLKIPQKISEGEFEGYSNPADIRGSYSLEDISKSFEIDVETLSKAYNLTDIIDNPSSFRVNQLEEYYVFDEDIEIGTGSVRYFVSLYTGIPYESDDNVLPITALNILKEEDKITEELYNELKEISIDISKYLNTENIVSNEINEEDSNEEEEYVIKSTTTVLEVVRWGISIEELKDLIGVTKISEDDVIRDVCLDNGLSFSEVKEKISALLN